MVAALSVDEIWACLRQIPDPEIPALSIVDLGIVRDVEMHADQVTVTITPTYSACPAMELIAAEIESHLRARGVAALQLETKLSPPWTTDWLSEEAKQRLREYGIAPPGRLVPLTAIAPSAAPHVICPHCGSDRVTLVSRYGSTLCKALYKCLSCLEPFDAFKSH